MTHLQMSTKGGKSKSAAKLAAMRRNLEKAWAATRGKTRNITVKKVVATDKAV